MVDIFVFNDSISVRIFSSNASILYDKKTVNSVQTHWTINDVCTNPIFIQEIILDGYLPCQDLHSIVHVLSLAPPKFDDFYPAHPDK